MKIVCHYYVCGLSVAVCQPKYEDIVGFLSKVIFHFFVLAVIEVPIFAGLHTKADNISQTVTVHTHVFCVKDLRNTVIV